MEAGEEVNQRASPPPPDWSVAVPDTRRRTRYPLTLAVVLVSVAAYALLQSLVVPVLPTLQHALHTSQDTVTWVLTAYLLTASVATPILGRLGDMAGKKKVLVATLVILAAGAALGAVATSIGVMIVARAIQGVGGAVVPLSFGIIRDEAPRYKVSSGIGIAAALLAVGGGAGIVLAGPIVDALNYHWLFWIPAIVVSVAAAAAFLIVPESKSRTGGPSPRRAGPASLGLARGADRGPFRGPELGLDLRQDARPAGDRARARRRLVPRRGAGRRAAHRHADDAAPGGLDHQPGGAALRGRALRRHRLPARVRADAVERRLRVRGQPHGLWALPPADDGDDVLLRDSPSHIAARIGSKMVLFCGSLATVVPFAILAFAHQDPWPIYLASAVLGIGLGFAFAAMSNIIVESVPSDQVGVASGMNANIRTIGGSIGAAVMATIVTNGEGAGGFPTDSGYTNGFSFLMLAAILATLACLLIPSPRRDEQAVLAEAHVVEHAETGIVPAAGLVDLE